MIVEFRDTTGLRPIPSANRSFPAIIAGTERRMLESELQTAETRRTIARISGNDPLAAPGLPQTPVTYTISPATRIVQHVDTVRYLSGCPSARVDTTVFLMFGADSTRRLTTPVRTFGQAMAVTLINQMWLAGARDRIKAQHAPLPSDLPGQRDPCAP